MKYEEIYRQAMEKVSASDSWKAETLQKMAQESRKPQLVLIAKRAALPVAAAVAVISAALLLPQNDSLSTNTAGGNSHDLQMADLPAATPDVAAQPRTAMLFSEELLPTLAFSDSQLVEVSTEQLPTVVDLSAQTDTLPVWQQENEEFFLLGDYPLLSAQEAAEAANIGDFTDAELIYVRSMDYLQPCYRFTLQTQDSPMYATAICGEYY